jgi:hypothetical protein
MYATALLRKKLRMGASSVASSAALWRRSAADKFTALEFWMRHRRND